MMNCRTEPPRAAYLHVPFCRHHCGYCNFTVLAGREDLAEAYLDALQRELEGLGSPQPVETIFVGGGTPTRLPPLQLARLGELIRHWLPLEPAGEWTVEANPEDVDRTEMKWLAQQGVTRLSLGVQSFAGNKLRQLERGHDRETGRRVIETAGRYFGSVSVDLIFAAPGETLEQWLQDLEQAIQLNPQHVSTYALTIEKGTTFFNRWRKGDLVKPSEELERDMYLKAIELLVDAGYTHYEVSNFAQPGQICRHNEHYWLGSSYFAFGAGASRYVEGRRETNHRSTTTYIRRVLSGASPVAEAEEITPEQHARDVLVFGLRRRAGLSRSWFRENTGFDMETLAGAVIDRFTQLGLLEERDGVVRVTADGLLLSDSMWPHFL